MYKMNFQTKSKSGNNYLGVYTVKNTSRWNIPVGNANDNTPTRIPALELRRNVGSRNLLKMQPTTKQNVQKKRSRTRRSRKN